MWGGGSAPPPPAHSNLPPPLLDPRNKKCWIRQPTDHVKSFRILEKIEIFHKLNFFFLGMTRFEINYVKELS